MKRRHRWELRQVRRRLQRLDRQWLGPDLEASYQAGLRQLEARVDRLGATAVTEELLKDFDGYCETFATTWKGQVHQHYRSILTTLDELYTKIRPRLDREDGLVEDLRAELDERRKAVTDALYRIANDDEPRYNPLRRDSRHANPPGQASSIGEG